MGLCDCNGYAKLTFQALMEPSGHLQIMGTCISLKLRSCCPITPAQEKKYRRGNYTIAQFDSSWRIWQRLLVKNLVRFELVRCQLDKTEAGQVKINNQEKHGCNR
jgi:hypothetical protein